MRDEPKQSSTGPSPGAELVAAARFAVPSAPSVHVPRPRLTAALAEAQNVPLVLVSAPAGTGKTALVAEWARSEPGHRVCWVSFENEERSFWPPLLAVLRRQGLGVPSSWTVPADGGLGNRRLHALTGLIAGASEHLTVVLDGYELDSQVLAREVDHLLRHSVGRVCFVFIGRVDPILPLYRYRLTDSVLEVRAPDLAFSDDEAAYLLKSTGVELGCAAVHDLNQRLGGWAAGLRFAARALAARDDAEGYVASVVEQTVDINQYLVAEVLDAEPLEVRRFLVDTCVTSEFCSDLVERIGGPGAVHVMNDLVDHQAFVEPVQGRPGCFRYHPFFRSFLLAELSYESPARLAEIRRTVAAWYRAQGQHARSLALLATIGAWQAMSAQLVEDGLVGRLLLEEPGEALGDVVRSLPPAVDGPAAALVRAVTALKQGPAGKDRCARELSTARRTLRGEDRSPQLEVAIAVTNALRAALGEDAAAAAGAIAEAEQSLAGTPGVPSRGSDPELWTVSAFAAGVVALRRGDLTGASIALSRAATPVSDGVAAAFRADCLGHLAVADALRGELGAAVRHAEEALAVAGQAGIPTLAVPPSPHVALAWVGVERCDDRLTTENVTAARSSSALPADPFCAVLVEAATAALEESTGRVAPAFDRLVAAADAAAFRDPWIADQLRVEVARLSVREGNARQALDVLASVELSSRPEVAVAEAAATVEQGAPRPVKELPIRDGAAPVCTQVRALLVEASEQAQHRSPDQAAAVLARALRLAAAEHLRRPFRELSTPRRLLSSDPRLAREHDWLHHTGMRAASSSSSCGPAGLPLVVEPLTPKEREVLGHLAELLTTDEIASVMFVSVNTVRTHIRKILRKLGVSRRNAAIRRARELGLLED